MSMHHATPHATHKHWFFGSVPWPGPSTNPIPPFIRIYSSHKIRNLQAPLGLRLTFHNEFACSIMYSKLQHKA